MLVSSGTRRCGVRPFRKRSAIAPMSVIGGAHSTMLPGGILNDGFATAWITNVISKAKPYGQGWEQSQVDKGDTVCAENQLLHGQYIDNVEQARHLIAELSAPDAADTLDDGSLIAETVAALEALIDELELAQADKAVLQKAVPAPAQPARSSIVIAGWEAHVCLLQTALELLELEFAVWVVTDACSSRTERNRDAAFDRLAGCGAELVTTEMVCFEWLRSAEHPLFKPMQALIK